MPQSIRFFLLLLSAVNYVFLLSSMAAPAPKLTQAKSCITFGSGRKPVFLEVPQSNVATNQFVADKRYLVVSRLLSNLTSAVYIKDIVTGEERKFEFSDGISEVTYSTSLKKILLKFYDRSVTIVDIQTDAKKKIPAFTEKNYKTAQSYLMPSGRHLVYFGEDKKSSILLNLETGKQLRLPGTYTEPFGNFLDFGSTGPENLVITEDESEGRFYITDLLTQKTEAYSVPKGTQVRSLSADGNKVLKVYEKKGKKKFTIWDRKKNRETTVLEASANSQSNANLTADGNYIHIEDGKNYIYDIQKDNKSKPLSVETYFSARSKSSRKLGANVTDYDSPKMYVYDLDTGTEKYYPIPKEPYGRQARFTRDGKQIMLFRGNSMNSSDSSVDMLSLESGSLYRVKAPKDFILNEPSDSQSDITDLIAMKGIWGTGQAKDVITVLSTDHVCVQDRFTVNSSTQQCVSPQKESAPLRESETKLVESLQVSQLCEKEFNKETRAQWDKETPIPASVNLTEEQAEKFLLRFQKPNGFEIEKHLPILLAVLKSNLCGKKRALVFGALQTVLHTSPSLFTDILGRFPQLLDQSAAEGMSLCRTPQELSILCKDATDYLNSIRSVNGGKTKFSDWNTLLPLGSLLASLDKSKKEELKDSIAQSLADGAADTSDFRGVFLSKLYKLAFEAVTPFFGEKPQPLTDLTLIRQSDQVSPILLGVAAIDDDPKTRSEFGFFVKKLPVIKLPVAVAPGETVANQSVSWIQDGKKYNANIQIKGLEKKTDLIPNVKAPRYTELWSDGVLSGMVIVGSNMRGDAAFVLDEYLAYYQKNGFEFPEKTSLTSVKDCKGFLGAQIQSGELDYFIKEAHSDGDEKNVFRIDTSCRTLKGSKKLKDGKTESVHLVFPSDAADKTTLIPNQEFGEWIRHRQKKKKGQFVYFNTSCWSNRKAIYEIEAAQSETLLDIPATTQVYPFANHPKNAEHILLSQFRDRKTYEEMRKALEDNEGYMKSTDGRFIFPDEYDYAASITNIISKLRLDMRAPITDQNGKPYSLEQEQ